MKYQTIGNACSYAALASLLDSFDFDVQDSDIMLGSQLAYMLRYDAQSRGFIGGTALEGRKWFDLFLRPREFHFVERIIPADKMLDCLWNIDRRAMLALKLSGGERHVLVFDGVRGESFRFINVKWQKSPAPESYILTAGQLLDCLERENTVGFIEKCEKNIPDFPSLFEETLSCVEIYRECAERFLSEPRQPYELFDARRSIFSVLWDNLHPLFKLCGEARLALMTKKLCDCYDRLTEPGTELLPSEHFPTKLLNESLDRYCEVVSNRSIIVARDGVL